MATVASALVGAVLGLSLAAPPGPMNALIAEETVTRGWKEGFKTGTGAMTADGIFCVLAFGGVTAFVESLPRLRSAMSFAGGLVMVYFAYSAVRNVREGFGRDTGRGTGFSKALVVSLTNPYQITWWLTVGVTLVGERSFEFVGFTTGGGIDVLAGFFGGILVWITGFPALLTAGRRRVDRLAPAVAYVSAALLTVFGVSFVYSAV